jgi:hypothetical protein
MLSQMSDDVAEELRRLRARAYGPDADIRDDPDALQRLRELEGHALGTPVPDAEAHADRAAPAGEPAVAASGLRPPWWERHRALLWGASLLLAVILGAALVSAQQSPGRERVAVLDVDADGQWPEQMWGPRPPDGVTFEEYRGLTAIASARDFGNRTSSTCLWVYDSTSVNFGLSAGSCTAGSVPASATILVTEQAPRPLLEEFGEGTALEFVLDRDRVLVYAQRP